MRLSDMVMYATVLIRCQRKDGTFGTGTGFIMNLCKDNRANNSVPVIITNKHVTNGSVKCRFDLCQADKMGKPIDSGGFVLAVENAPWIHHPDSDVDLCCLPVAGYFNRLSAEEGIDVFYTPLETSVIPSEEMVAGLSTIEDVIMIGYPIGLSDTKNHKPVARKGITATHVKLDYEGKKQFLIDCACFPGSSGSPIFILNEGSYMRDNGLYFGSRIILLGVLFAGPQFTATGTITYANIPVAPSSRINIPMNLGLAIKSSEILVLENYIEEKIAKLEQGDIHDE